MKEDTCGGFKGFADNKETYKVGRCNVSFYFVFIMKQLHPRQDCSVKIQMMQGCAPKAGWKLDLLGCL